LSKAWIAFVAAALVLPLSAATDDPPPEASDPCEPEADPLSDPHEECEPPPPTREERSDQEQGWVAWALETEGATFWLNRTVSPAPWPLHFGVALYNASTLALLDWGTLQNFGGQGLRVRAGGSMVIDTFVARQDESFGAITTLKPPSGRYFVVAWSAGDGQWSHVLEGHDRIRLLAREEGSRVFSHTSKDFHGPATVQAWPGGPGSVQAIPDGSLAIEARDTLLLFGFSRVLGFSRLSVVSPGGSEQACPCLRFEMTGAGALGPGAYTARLASAGVGDLNLAGADVRLPPPPARWNQLENP